MMAPPVRFRLQDDVAAVDTFAQALRLEGYEVQTALSTESGLHAEFDRGPNNALWIKGGNQTRALHSR